jgi:hypothetical protein
MGNCSRPDNPGEMVRPLLFRIVLPGLIVVLEIQLFLSFLLSLIIYFFTLLYTSLHHIRLYVFFASKVIIYVDQPVLSIIQKYDFLNSLIFKN